jgi:aminomethyltransferase
VIVTRTGWTAEVGYEVYLLDARRGTDLWERIIEAGRAFDIRPTGPVDIRRIEGGIFNWGCDFDHRNNPFEMGLERLVDLDTEAEFMGKAALRRIRDEGVSRRIVGVGIDGPPLDLNAVKWPIRASDGERDPIGEVTSAVWSPRLKKNIGYAWLPLERADTGSVVAVDTEAGPRRATVVPIPFVDPGKVIPRS